MPRTRIRGEQEQDSDFLSEDELNEFFGKTVITGTIGGGDNNEIQDTAIIETFNSYFPGQGLITGADGVIVITGTELVTTSGFYTEFVTASGALQTQINDFTSTAGVYSITASGTTVSGAVIFEGEGTTSLSVDGQTITISGSQFHEDIDSLVHNLSEDTFVDLTRDQQGRVTDVDTYTPEGPVSGTLIRSVDITRDQQGRVTTVVENQHDASGAIIQILTTTINRGLDNRATSIETDEVQLGDFF